MKRMLTAIGTALVLTQAAAFAEDAAAKPASATVPAAASAKKYPVKLQDIKLTAIGKMGDEASVTIELPAGAAKPGEKVRKTFRKGAVIPGSGYTIKEVDDDVITLERDGKTESLKITKGGAGLGLPGLGSGDVEAAMKEFGKMTPEQRAKARGDLQKAKQMLTLLKSMSVMDDAKMDPASKEKLGMAETMLDKADSLFSLAEQLETAKAGGDTAKQAELTKAIEGNVREINDMKAKFEDGLPKDGSPTMTGEGVSSKVEIKVQ